MKYIRLFEQFEEGHKFDLLDLYLIDLKEVEKLFFKELKGNPPDLENIQVFLDSGLVDVHTKGGEYGWTPLHYAAVRNSLAVAQLLISSGAEVNAKDNDDDTPLHYAAVRNSLEVAELLISSGAEVNAKNDWGRTPLHRAAINGYQEMQELLISHGGVR